MIKLFLFLLIANIFFIFSQSPLLLRYYNTEKNMIFPLNQGPDYNDYYQYLSAITQGKYGSWLYRDAFTSEKTKPGIILIFYILIGKIGGIFHLWPPVIYHLARIIIVELFFITSFYFLKTYFSPIKTILAGVIMFSITISPQIFFDALNIPIAGIIYDNIDALKRLDSRPHHILGYLLQILIFLLVIKNHKKLTIKHLFLISALSFVGGIIFTPMIIPLITVLPLAYFFELIRSYIKKTRALHQNKERLIKIIFVFIFCGIASIIIKIGINQGFPWDIWSRNEIVYWNIYPDMDLMLLKALALPLLTSLPVMIWILWKKPFEYIFLVFWTWLPFVLFPVINLFGMGKYRLLHLNTFFPLGILTALALITLTKFKFTYLIMMLFIMINIYTSFQNINIKQIQNKQLNESFYFSKEIFNIINFTNENIPEGSTILSDELAVILPSYSPVISYLGHAVLTKNLTEKQYNIQRFYSQQLSDEEVNAFLKDGNINFVYFGQLEKNYSGKNELGYNNLKEISREDDVIIYKVI